MRRSTPPSGPTSSLREKLDGDADIAEIRRETEELAKASQDVATEAYKEAESAAGDAASESEATADEEADEGEYIDAEYDEQ